MKPDSGDIPSSSKESFILLASHDSSLRIERFLPPIRRPHLDGGGIRGERGGAQVAAQQGVERRAERGVCGPPVRLQVLGQVFARVFQLVLVQDDIEHLLKEGGEREEAA